MRADMKKAVIYVAETACCGLIIHDPSTANGAKPCHPNKTGNYPAYVTCRIIRYWDFRAKRQVSRKQLMKAQKEG